MGIAWGTGRRLALGAIHKVFDLLSAAYCLLFHLPRVLPEGGNSIYVPIYLVEFVDNAD